MVSSLFFSLAEELTGLSQQCPCLYIVVDGTVGQCAYDSTSGLLYPKLEPGSPGDISELNR